MSAAAFSMSFWIVVWVRLSTGAFSHSVGEEGHWLCSPLFGHPAAARGPSEGTKWDCSLIGPSLGDEGWGSIGRRGHSTKRISHWLLLMFIWNFETEWRKSCCYSRVFVFKENKGIDWLPLPDRVTSRKTGLCLSHLGFDRMLPRESFPKFVAQ